jgi:hypothetical protein
VNPKELKVDVLEVGVNQVSLLGKLGGAVITKAPLASQNAAVEALSQRALADQMEKRRDYMRQERSSSKIGQSMSMEMDYAQVAKQRPVRCPAAR